MFEITRYLNAQQLDNHHLWFYCELETQTLLGGDLGFIEKGELGTAKKDIA